MRMHEDQLPVTAGVVRRLVRDQFPEWFGLSIVPVRAAGTVNAIFRIGGAYAARFPLQPGDVDTVRQRLTAEAEAARELSAHTRFAVPRPVALGEPGHGYPLPWSVQTWLPGTTASGGGASGSVDMARDLARFIGDVRSIGLAGRTFSGRGRGGDLRDHDEWVGMCLARSNDLVDVPSLRSLWTRLRELPREAPDVMTHGDLIPGNVLVEGGRLTGILDVGGLGAADAALDLVAAWHLLAAGPRLVLRRVLGCNDLEWERGKAWALEQALGAVWYYVDSNPDMSRMGRQTLRRILASESSG